MKQDDSFGMVAQQTYLDGEHDNSKNPNAQDIDESQCKRYCSNRHKIIIIRDVTSPNENSICPTDSSIDLQKKEKCQDEHQKM